MIERLEIRGLACIRAPGEGPKVLFVHGAHGGAWYWERFMLRFAARGFDVYAVNLRGHGPNPRLDALGNTSVFDYVEDVYSVHDALGVDVLFGHSMGGLVAQKVAESRAFKALVLACPATPKGVRFRLTNPLSMFVHALPSLPAAVRGRSIGLRWRMARKFSLNNMSEAAAREAFSHFTKESSRIGGEVAGIPRVSIDPGRMSGPTLVVGCDRDQIIPLQMCRALANYLKSDLVILEEAGHMFPIERQWQRSADILLSWIERTVGGSSIPVD